MDAGIGARIRSVRKGLGLTQKKFAEKIGKAENSVTIWESGARPISDYTIALICSRFDVNEKWLRTGAGDPFVSMSKKEQITKFVADVLTDDDSFKMRLISALTEMDVDEWTILESLVDKLNKNPQ